MKTFAFIVALCVSGALADVMSEQITTMLRYKDECMVEFGIDPEMIEQAMKEGDRYQREDQLECFMACILKKAGILNDDGSINAEAAKEHAPGFVSKNTFDDNIEKCKDARGANDCETAGNFAECIMEKELASTVQN